MFNNHQNGYGNQQNGFNNQQGYGNQQNGYGNYQGYGNQQGYNNQQMGYNNQQMGYNNQQMYGNQPAGRKQRVTKGMVIQYVQDYCYQQTGVSVTKVEKIQECPTYVRHACMNVGVGFLPMNYVNIPTESGYITVNFFFCNSCGKLFIYDEFM